MSSMVCDQYLLHQIFAVRVLIVKQRLVFRLTLCCGTTCVSLLLYQLVKDALLKEGNILVVKHFNVRM